MKRNLMIDLRDGFTPKIQKTLEYLVESDSISQETFDEIKELAREQEERLITYLKNKETYNKANKTVTVIPFKK